MTKMTNELKKAIETVKSYLDLDSDVDSEYLNAQRTIIQALEQQLCEDKGEISDGYHTFNQLYHQRAILFATIVNQNKDKAWKSFKHSDGHYCFDEGGEMFIVGIDTPKGSYTYHYHKKYWDYFDCKELECGKVWDGHTEEDVTRLLSLEQKPKRCDSCIHSEEQDSSTCYECIKGMTDNFEAQQTDKCKGCYYDDGETHAECVICDKEAQPTDADCISRTELLSRIDAERKHLLNIKMDGAEHIIVHHARRIIEDMSPVTPSYNSIKTELKPCEDCISRSELLRHQHIIYDDDGEGYKAVYVKDIKAMPSVIPERPKGTWIDIRVIKSFHYDGEPRVRCSRCGNEEEWSSNYCPNCGSYNGGNDNGDE